ncbi:MAG: hypothetical protein HeimC2_19870 [Candidatus Heimdallarchaeota archaeon LC_2]|nr:MAG: hypothetical protein HeimC2_19870 [Candidatus Heimdallarchaeota archaeon LC_2]
MFNSKITSIILGMNLRSYLKQGRAVSPVIATILLITVSLAAGTTVATLLSNIEDRTPTIDTDAALGVTGSTSVDTFSIETEITKLSGDIELQILNIDDYTKLTISLSYAGENAFIYVIDFDILVYGIKLDDFSSWTITDAIGATYTTVNGQYGGYEQAKDTTVQYVLEVEDRFNDRARLPSQTTFSYEVKIGENPGVISKTILKERESKVIFSYIAYNITIFHWGSSFAVNSAARQIEDSLALINGTNNLFFIYTRANDAYDISNPTVVSNMNATAISEYYQVVMVDKWAVPASGASVITDIHSSGTSLVFYGTIIDFDPSGRNANTVLSRIDLPATKNITGLIPNLYNVGTNVRSTDNGYQFVSSIDGTLTGLSGSSFTEVPSQINQLFQRTIGDTVGFDAALFTDVGIEQFDVFGNSSYTFYDVRRNPSPADIIWEHNGPLFIRKNGITNVTGDVYSFTWKTHENFPDTGALKTDEYHLATVIKNMILSLVSELERQSFTYAEMSLDSLNLNVRNGNRRFEIEVTMSVQNADVNGATLELTVDLPDELNIDTGIFSTPRYAMYINGNRVVNNEFFGIDLITPDNVFFIDVGEVYTETILENSVILIVIDGLSGWLSLENSNTNFYDWLIHIDFQSGVIALPSSDELVVNTAISTAVW